MPTPTAMWEPHVTQQPHTIKDTGHKLERALAADAKAAAAFPSESKILPAALVRQAAELLSISGYLICDECWPGKHRTV